MKTFNNESMILEEFREESTCDIKFIGNFLKCKWIYFLLTGIFSRKNWVNSSKKSDPPPDFYNNKHKIMMDVMRIDDTTFKNKKGTLVDLTRQKEEKFLKSYLGNNYKNERNDINCYVVASSGLPTIEDHNFERYYKNFERVFREHESKLSLYQSNHPGFKTIFFIFDESTAYVEVTNPDDVNKERHEGDLTPACKPHLFFLDKKFINIFRDSNIDYIIWYAPWKMIRYMQNNRVKIYPLPKCAIYDIKGIRKKRFVDYNHKMMISSEE